MRRDPQPPQDLPRMVGRDPELGRASNLLQRDGAATGEHVVVTGERGVGKSLFLRHLAGLCRPHHLAPAFVSIDPTLTTDSFTARLGLSLERSIHDLFPLRGVLGRLRRIVPGVSVAGVHLDLAEEEIGDLDRFCFRLVDIGRIVADRWRGGGIVLIVDEADSADGTKLPLGAVLKTLLEYLSFHGCGNVSLLLAGLPRIRSTLQASHPSTWRVFHHIALDTLDGTSSCTMIEVVAEGGRGEVTAGGLDRPTEIHLRRDARYELRRLAEGFPNWLEEYTIAAIERALGGHRRAEHESLLVTLDDVQRGRRAALARISESYYQHDLSTLPEPARLTARWLASFRSRRVPAEALSAVWPAPASELAQGLAALRTAEMVTEEHVGSRCYYRLSSEGFRSWLGLLLEPRIEPSELDPCHQVLAELDGRRLTIAGENVPPFRVFCDLLLAGTSGASRGFELRAEEYDASEDLFETLPLDGAVRGLRQRLELGDAERATSGRFEELWQEADIVCIPHYLLGQAATQLEVHDLDELLEPPAGGPPRYRSYVEYVLSDFHETCTFEGRWIAVPFSYLTKVLVSKRNVPSPERWIAPYRGLARNGAELTDRLLLEGQPDRITLWLEWRQTVDPELWTPYERSRSDTVPTIHPAFRELADRVSELPFAKRDTVGVFCGLREFGRLLSSVPSRYRGTVYWGDAEEFLSAEVDYYSCWTDWAVKLQEASEATDDPDGSVEARERTDLTWYELPSLCGGSKGQPVESWVFVLPRRPGSDGQRERARKLARLLLGTLHSTWQEQFQRAAGCSPIARLVHASSISMEQPWGSILGSAIERNHPRGRSPVEVALIQAEIAFLTFTLFPCDRHPSVDEWEKRLWERFQEAFPPFVETLGQIVAHAPGDADG